MVAATPLDVEMWGRPIVIGALELSLSLGGDQLVVFVQSLSSIC